MKFSAQEEYGLRCLVALASEGPGASLSIPDISAREGLTQSHVAKLLSILRKGGFVKSTRGQLGGYVMGLPPEETPVRMVLECLGGRLYADGFCDRHSGLMPECVHETECLMRPLWSRVQNAVDRALDGVTLADLVENRWDDKTVIFHAQPHKATVSN